MRLGFSAQATWMTRNAPQFTGQAMLSIPLGQGVELPLVYRGQYRYANRIGQYDQSSSEARLGFPVDVARIAQDLR